MRLSKLLIIGISIVAALSFIGCTPYEKGLATGVVVGAAGATAYHDNYYYEGYNYGPNRNEMYRRGVRDGCRSSRGRWIKRRYEWNHFPVYREGWSAGYRRCR